MLAKELDRLTKEYVAAEKIEMAVSKSKFISQPWIYGNSFMPMLVAVVTPDFIELEEAAKAGGWHTATTTTFGVWQSLRPLSRLRQRRAMAHTPWPLLTSSRRGPSR